MFLWQVCAESVLAHFRTRAPLGEEDLALEVHFAPIDVCRDDLVERNLGEASVAEAQGRDPVGGADATLNGTYPAYP